MMDYSNFHVLRIFLPEMQHFNFTNEVITVLCPLCRGRMGLWL